MLIDWFTVGAQVLNFLVLVWLMKRFLYKPILSAIDAREKATEATIADSEAKKSAAQKEHDEFDRKNKEFDQNRAALLSKAAADAKAQGQKIADDAKKTAEDLSVKQQKSLQDQAKTLREAISHRAQTEVFAIARKALTDLAGVDLEERMVDSFVRQLQGLDQQAKSQLTKAPDNSKEIALVRSAFELNAGLRTKLENVIKGELSQKFEVRFETKSDLIGGVELILSGQKVAWTFAEYLTSLERGVAEVLKSQSAPHGI
jgi:F-type H+-transporting ATPase subunit b